MRMRLLPILMFAMVATLSVKVGKVWNDLEIGIGTSAAQTGETQAGEAPPGETQPSEPQTGETPPAAASSAEATATPAATEAAPQPSTAQAPDQAQPAEAGTTAAEGEAGQQQTVASAGDVAEPEVRTDPFDFTDEEIEVLQQLSKRRAELDQRARELEDREALVKAAEQRMEQKMAELKVLQDTVQEALNKRSEEEENQLKSLVKIYENMKPKDAAQVFEEMDMDILLDVVSRMNERKAAPVLALITPTRAKEITLELAQRRALPMPQ